jgi:hypothetical protein
VIEEPPFAGTGFTAAADPLIQERPIPEFTVSSIRLPHRTEVYRIDEDGEETLIGLYDADRDGWLLVDLDPADGAPAGGVAADPAAKAAPAGGGVATDPAAEGE